jgi:hypothetical protein
VLPVGAELGSAGFESSGPFGHVVAQESFLSGTVVRSLHPRSVTFKDAITLRHLIGRGNENAYKLSLSVVGQSRFSEFKSIVCASRKKGLPQV